MQFADWLFEVFALIGTIAFAISGAIVAIEKQADLFGVLFLGVTTSCGGGLLRDITMGNLPPSMFFNGLHVWAAVLTSLTIFVLARIFQQSFLQNLSFVDRVTNVADALGLGACSVIGAQIVLRAGYTQHMFLVVTMGMFTAVGGGMLRDLLLREIPVILHKRIYALASIFGATVYYALWSAGVFEAGCVFAGVGATFLLRILATVFEWNLPRALKYTGASEKNNE